MLREKELVLLENLKTDNERKTEEIQQLRNNQLIGQASGEETATITDGALAFANILEETEIEVEGKKKKAYLVGLPQGISRQEQREGYNLFDAINSYPETHTKTGITFTKNSDGTFNVHGTATSNTSIGLATGIMGYLVAGEEYSLYSNIPYNNNTFNLSLTYGGEGMTNKYILANSSKILDDITQWATLNLYIPNGQTINVDNVKVMICKGAYDSSKPFEQYGETPSIEIPSEIENVKAWNLIDVEQIAQQTQNVITTFDKKNGWLTIENSNSNMAYVNILVPVEHIIIGKTYSLKVEFKSEEGCNVYLQKSAEDYSNFTQGIDDIIKNTAIDTYMKVLITPIANQTVTVRLSLAEEQEKIENKTYAPYGAISIGLGNKNLFDKNNYISLNSYFNNTGNPNISSLVTTKSIFLECKENTEYTISRKTGKRFYVGYINDYPANGILVNNVLGTDTKEVNEYTLTTGLGAKYLAIYLYNSQYDTNITFEEMINSLQVEERDTATPYTEHQEQNYNLHIGDLELNGINDIRDSFVVELDNSYSHKKIKKLYLKKLYNIKKILYFEYKHTSIFDENRGFYQIRLIDCKINIGSDESKKYYKINYLKVVNNNGAQQTFNTYEEGFWKENNAVYGYFILPFTTLADANNWLQELNTQGNPLKILYPLEEPKLIDLTDDYPELVKDLEYLINNFKTFKEVTHVEVDNGYIDLEYVKSTELALKNIQQQIDNISALMLEGGTGNA